MSELLFNTPVIRDTLRRSPIEVIDVGVAGGVMDILRPPGGKGLFVYNGFEPHPVTFGRLPQVADTTYHQLALSNRTGRAPFYSHSTDSSLEQRVDREEVFKTEYDVTEVDIDTLENLRNTGLLARLDVVKTDAERHDYYVLEGMGSYKEEPLCVIAEFHYYTRMAGAFSDIDRLLTDSGMLLFALSHKHGPLGELEGGDLIYLRDIGTIVRDGSEDARNRLTRLIALSAMLGYQEYAYIAASIGSDCGLLSHAEANEIKTAIQRRVFLPRAVPRFTGGPKIAHMLSILGQILSSNKVGAKATPKANRLSPSRRLFAGGRRVPRSWRHRYENHLENRLEWYKGLRGVAYDGVPKDGPPKA